MNKTIYPRFTDTLISLEGTKFDYQKTSIPDSEGEFIRQLIIENKYQKTLEVGLALGISALYICDAIAQFEQPSHTIIDPNQSKINDNIGLKNLEKRGLKCFTFIEEPSELALPKLLEQETVFDFAFIDGWHTFDHAMLDFFYINRMLRVGGMVVFDDVNLDAIGKLVKYLGKYPAYELVLPDFGIVKTPKNRLFEIFKKMIKLFPWSIRREVFSDKINYGLPNQLPKFIALKKIAEDQRNHNWFEPF